MKRLQRVLFVPDTHVPYHDKEAFGLMLKAGKSFKPDVIAVLGDFADFYSVSSHSKDPRRVRDLESELTDVNAALDQLDALGATRKIFVSGNHEDRLERYLQDKAPELFNIVKIPELFRLKARGWEYVPYKHDIQLGKLWLTHDVGTAGVNAHRDALSSYQSNCLIGHTHRIGYAVVGNARGVPHLGAMLGWLGDFSTVDYMHRVKARRDWAHGFGIGYMEPSGVVHVTPVPIVKGRVVIEGRMVRAPKR
jgi:predicted phosphodiesterase